MNTIHELDDDDAIVPTRYTLLLSYTERYANSRKPYVEDVQIEKVLRVRIGNTTFDATEDKQILRALKDRYDGGDRIESAAWESSFGMEAIATRKPGA